MANTISQPRYTCALGAQQTVLAIPGGIPIVHAGPGCSSKAFGFLATGAGQQGEGYAGGNQISCTNASETEVVFGGEKKLRQLVESTFKVLNGDLFVILSGCTAGIIGDDVVAIAKEFRNQGFPITGVDTPGFRGSNYYGHEAVIKSIIQQYIGDRNPVVKKRLVNVFADVPFQDPYWRGDLEEIKRLLEDIGLEVNVLFGVASEGIKEWNRIPDAEFNLLISPWVGLDIVELLKEKYGTPYLQYPVLPIGAVETSRFLKKVGKFAGLNGLDVQRVISREEKRYYQYFEGIVDFLAEYQTNLPYKLYTAADSLYALSYTKYLEQELGFIPERVYITDDPTPEKEEIVRSFIEKELSEYKDIFVINKDNEQNLIDLKNRVKYENRALILGSDWERDIAKETGNLFKYISIPIGQDLIIQNTHVGYRGGLNLIEDIYHNLFSGNQINSSTYNDSVVV